MKIIDLSLEISNGLEVFPGDPKVKIKVIEAIEENGFEVRRIHMNGHDGTHVNAQSHCLENGKSLDDYSLDTFYGDCVVYEEENDIVSNKGILFDTINIDENIKNSILKNRPKFICLSSNFEFDIEIEKELVQADIICFERIHNTHKLPKKFQFFGMPLKIKNGDGSPIRAFAIVE